MKFKGPRLDIMRDVLAFVNKSNVPPDVLIIVSGHAESFTGNPAHCNSKTNYAASSISLVSSSAI